MGDVRVSERNSTGAIWKDSRDYSGVFLYVTFILLFGKMYQGVLDSKFAGSLRVCECFAEMIFGSCKKYN